MKKRDLHSGMCMTVSEVDERKLGWAFRLANDLFEHAKAGLIGRIPRTEALMAGFSQSNATRTYVLNGPIFRKHEMPIRDQQDLAVRLIAHCTDASAVVRAGGFWVVVRCAACGCWCWSHKSPCRRCGAEAVPVPRNRYRHWYLNCELQVRGLDEMWSWTSRALHDPRHRILAWDDEHGGKRWGIIPGPWNYGPWRLKPWMRPHFTLNLPVVQRVLGRQPEPRAVAAAHKIEARASVPSPLLRVSPHRLKKALEAVNTRTFHRKERVTCAPGVIR
jgi:hypothetical protein